MHAGYFWPDNSDDSVGVDFFSIILPMRENRYLVEVIFNTAWICDLRHLGLLEHVCVKLGIGTD